jgi:uncharacterized protein YeaC (DUF1315 family)
MADYTQLMNLEKKPKKQVPPPHAQESSPNQSTEQSINQSTDQSINRLTERLTNRLNHPTSIKVMDKPRGFYITEQLNKRIDEAVRYYQEQHNLKKVDRSIVVTALLDNEANWTEEALDLLLDRILNQLTSRLTNR